VGTVGVVSTPASAVGLVLGAASPLGAKLSPAALCPNLALLTLETAVSIVLLRLYPMPDFAKLASGMGVEEETTGTVCGGTMCRLIALVLTTSGEMAGKVRRELGPDGGSVASRRAGAAGKPVVALDAKSAFAFWESLSR